MSPSALCHMSFQSINTVVFEPIKFYRKLYVLHKTQIASVFVFFVQRIGSLNTVLISQQKANSLLERVLVLADLLFWQIC